MNKSWINGQPVIIVVNATSKSEIVVMETLDKRIILYYPSILRDLNNLSMQQWKF